MDGRLSKRRFVVVRSAASRQQMKLMAITTGAVASTRIASVKPQRHAIGSTRPTGVSLRLLILALDRYLHAQAKLIPCQVHVRITWPGIERRETLQPIFGGEIEELVLVLPWDCLAIPAGKA